MEIFVRVKALGRRRDILAPVPYTIPDDIRSLRQLLAAVAGQEAEGYNDRGTQTGLIHCLSRQEVDEQAETGKVGFGRIWSDRKADPVKAAALAVRCWEDGLVRVFMNDAELTDPDGALEIPEGAVFTFVRLAFLTGSIW